MATEKPARTEPKRAGSLLDPPRGHPAITHWGAYVVHTPQKINRLVYYGFLKNICNENIQ